MSYCKKVFRNILDAKNSGLFSLSPRDDIDNSWKNWGCMSESRPGRRAPTGNVVLYFCEWRPTLPCCKSSSVLMASLSHDAFVRGTNWPAAWYGPDEVGGERKSNLPFGSLVAVYLFLFLPIVRRCSLAFYMEKICQSACED